LYKVIILSDSYRLPLSIGSFIVVANSGERPDAWRISGVE